MRPSDSDTYREVVNKVSLSWYYVWDQGWITEWGVREPLGFPCKMSSKEMQNDTKTCKIPKEGCKITTKWQQSGAKQLEVGAKTSQSNTKRCKMTTKRWFLAPTLDQNCHISQFSLSIVTSLSCFTEKHASEAGFPAMHVKGSSRAHLLFCILFIHVPSPALEDCVHCDTRLSKYWPLKGPSIDGRRSLVQPCSRLSFAPHLFTNPQPANQKLCSDASVRQRRKEESTKTDSPWEMWHLKLHNFRCILFLYHFFSVDSTKDNKLNFLKVHKVQR